MGSGGLQGLQIPRSGAFGVRGGFDSHAFPPLVRRLLPLLAALFLAGALVGESSAQGANPAPPAVPATPAAAGKDSLAATARPDTTVVDSTVRPRAANRGRQPKDVQVVGDHYVRSDSTRHRPWTEQPRMVMARSLIFPGWGQMHNHAWFKAALVMGGEGLLIGQILKDQKELDRMLGDISVAQNGSDPDLLNTLVNQYNARLDQRLSREWLLGGVVAYALVDAFVDANFRGFDVEFRHDPALPQGAPAGSPTGGGDDLGVRLAYRWHF